MNAWVDILCRYVRGAFCFALPHRSVWRGVALNTCSARCTHIDNRVSTRRHSAERKCAGAREKSQEQRKRKRERESAFVMVLHLNDHRLREHEHYVIRLSCPPPLHPELFLFPLHRFLSSWCHPLNPPSCYSASLNTSIARNKKVGEQLMALAGVPVMFSSVALRS